VRRSRESRKSFWTKPFVFSPRSHRPRLSVAGVRLCTVHVTRPPGPPRTVPNANGSESLSPRVPAVDTLRAFRTDAIRQRYTLFIRCCARGVVVYTRSSVVRTFRAARRYRGRVAARPSYLSHLIAVVKGSISRLFRHRSKCS